MRLFDGPKQGGDNNLSGSESSGSHSRNSCSSSSSETTVTNRAKKRNKNRARNRGQKGWRSKSENGLKLVTSVPNGVDVVINGGSRETSSSYGHYNNTQHNVIRNEFSPPSTPFTNGESGGNRNERNIFKMVKKFPDTPISTIISDKLNNNSNIDGNRSIARGGIMPSKPDGMLASTEDTDFVDYEDIGSSTSLSLYSENDKQEHKQKNFQFNHPNRKLDTKSASSSKMDYSKYNIDVNVDGGNGAYATFGASSRSVSNDKTFNNEFNIDIDNIPCSSSSLRERLSSQPRSRNYSSSPSASKDIAPDTSHDHKIIHQDKMENHSLYTIHGDSLKRSASGKMMVIDDDDKPSSKYIHSGVGQHFGKKIPASSSLGDGESQDGRSVNRGGVGGDESVCAECLGYMLRLKTMAIVLLGTLLVLSISSLLFIFPIVVDPILLGLEAEFSIQPVNCRTTNIRSGKGPVECSLPSCRSGCTADLFVCTFVDVEYSYHIELATSTLSPSVPHTNNNITNNNDNDSDNRDFDNSTTLVTKQGTLFINILGCGYPPSVNCSEFYRNFGYIGSEFKCYHSSSNDSIVLNYYNYDEEKKTLLLSIFIPITLSTFSAILLFLLLKCSTCKLGTRSLTVNKSSSQLKLLDKDGVSLGSGVAGKSVKDATKKWKKRKDTDILRDNGVTKMNGVNGSHNHNHNHGQVILGEGPYMNGSVPKENGHAFENTVSGLMGLVSPATVSTLPHKFDIFDKPHSYLNGSPRQEHTRRPRYVKKNELNNRAPSFQGQGGIGENSTPSVVDRTHSLGDSPLFTTSTKDKRLISDKLAEHKL